MQFINKYLRNVQPYKLASHKIWAVSQENRKEILKLDWNEATIPPTPKVKERIKKLISKDDFYNLYPSTLNKKLLELLAAYVQLPEENIQYFGSSDALHEYIAKVFISVGDPVLILGPSYDNFRLTCQSNGAEVYYSSYNEDFSFNPDLFYKDILRVKPAVIYICNPNNPTGNLHSVEYIEFLLNEFADSLFIIDEAYYEFSGITVKDLVQSHDNLLISRTMSKAFALANFRVGYLIASKENIQFISRIRNPKNLSTLAQEAAIAVLSDIPYMQHYVKEVQEAYAYFSKALEKYSKYLKSYPSKGNFVIIRLTSVEEKKELISYLNDQDIFVRDLSQSPIVYDCFRITIGLKSQMDRVLSAIDSYFERRK